MKKILLTVVATATFLVSCKQEKKEAVSIPTPENTEFNQLLKDYNEGKLQLNPVSATFAGDNRFNDQFPNTLSDKYQAKSNEFFKNYKEKLNNFKDADLNESQQMSKAVLDWDCDMALAQASYKNDLLMPINQMWTINLTMGQLASGSSAQPFKTVEDYDNWLSRLDKYNTWLQSAKERMQQGMNEGYVLPKSLIKKVIPQFESLTIVKTSPEGITDFSEHLFYSPINTLPADFSDADKTR